MTKTDKGHETRLVVCATHTHTHTQLAGIWSPKVPDSLHPLPLPLPLLFRLRRKDTKMYLIDVAF